MPPHIQIASDNPDHWSTSYRGRHLAAHRHGQGWHIYLDRVMQPHKLFATAEDAAVWLQHQVDGRNQHPLSWPAGKSRRQRPARNLPQAA